MGRMYALLDPATDTQRYAPDCNVSSFPGKPVNDANGHRIGIVIRAWVQNGSLYGELEIPDVPPED